ncbi:hypothetical protein GCM10010967_30670 [Dyadobacter beijingensis]|uniref:Por secretion system C-terminal sorting domain-containing protein n=1 Tax=Dyadobacter beijingensis TaxID=365489 RepID=A0ABQ2I0E0_9BACT|nr:T9SS type A sorting domain-containing protein [Dyadobacter beijingensis]GGM95160.1 hypothetical protein GCM10010967_30670 [Dyadobacter beijingensis]
MIRFLLTLLVSCFSLTCIAQSPSIRILNVKSDNYCTGTDLVISVAVTGTFPAGNQFSVVVRRDWDASPEVWTYPAELKGSELITNLKDAKLANYERIVLKVVSSNPKTETENVSFRVISKSTLRIATRLGLAADTVNTGDPIELGLTVSPPSPGEVTLNTGEKFQLLYPSYGSESYKTNIKLPLAKAGTYSVKEASNACGPMAVSGQVTVRTNQLDFYPTSVFPHTVCEGGEFKVGFSTGGQDFAAGTQFKLRVYKGDEYAEQLDYADVPATLTGKNELTARFPEKFALDAFSTQFRIGIVTTNPASVTRNDGLDIWVSPKPAFKLTTENPSVVLGQSARLNAQLSGMPPYLITFTNGQKMTSSQLDVYPKATAEYKVKTFETGCGVIENPVHTPVTVTVRPGLYLGTPNSYVNRNFCAGQTVRLPFIAVGTGSQTTFTVEALTRDNQKFVFQAKVAGDSVEFTIPVDNSRDPLKNYGMVSRARLVSANPAMASEATYLTIQGEPFMTFSNLSLKSVPFPSTVRMDYDLHGGGPFVLEYADGTSRSWDASNYWHYQFIRKDTIFQLKSLSNQCFRTTGLPAFPLKVEKPADQSPALFLAFPYRGYCMGDSVEVEVFFNGKFEAGNVFTIAYSKDAQSQEFPLMTITKQGRYKIRIPGDGRSTFTASLLLTSSLPRLVSETERFDLRPKSLYLGLYPDGSQGSPATISNNGGKQSLMVRSMPFTTVKYNVNGQPGTIVTDSQGDGRFETSLPPNQVSVFQATSAVNACGNLEKTVSSYLYFKEYTLTIGYPYENVYCAGTQAKVTFDVREGQAPAGTQFTLQMSTPESSNTFVDIATITDGRAFTITIPERPAGIYYMRVRSNAGVQSDPAVYRIGRKPEVVLGSHAQPGNEPTLAVPYGGDVHLYVRNTGTAPWNVQFADGQVERSDQEEIYYTKKVTGPEVFTLAKAWNTCGFGTVSGKVTVNVKPVLKVSHVPETGPGIFCAGQPVEVGYKISGIPSLGNNYLVFTLTRGTQKLAKLDSTQKLEGTMLLRIPSGYVGDQTLGVVATVQSMDLSGSLAFQPYQVPDMTLFGNNSIQAGQTVRLFVRANAAFAQNTIFELSDGTSYSFGIPAKGRIMEIEKQPAATTTYTLKAPGSVCGVGKVNGSATITVEPKKQKSLSIQSVEAIGKWYRCASDTVSVSFYSNGDLTGAVYTVHLSDSLGENFRPIPTFGTGSPLRAVIPAGTKAGNSYRIRITSSDPDMQTATMSALVGIEAYATARLTASEVFYQTGQKTYMVVQFEGSGPFNYRYGIGSESIQRYPSGNPDSLLLRPVSDAVEYRLLEVRNVCGVGKLRDPSVLKVELITGTEPSPSDEVLRFGPNPTGGVVDMWFRDAAQRDILLYNAHGTRLKQLRSRSSNAAIQLSGQPAGVYLLEIKGKRGTARYRIIKN